MATVRSPQPAPPPVDMQAHAMDNLRYIRRTMEQAGSFTAVPGFGGILVGLTALGASRLSSARATSRWNLVVWLAEACLAMSIGIAGAAWKSRRARQPLLTGPGRKFVAGFAPPMLAGGVLTALLYSSGLGAFLPGTWLLLYGTAVVSGGSASVRVVPLMGACFMAVGTAALFAPAWGQGFLAAGFGGLHVLFGIVIAVKYGG
jgi:hypothetical protein